MTVKADREDNGADQSAQSVLQLPYELKKAYEVLGISYTLTKAGIKATKRNLLRINHPDLVANKGAEAVNAATLKTQEINKAFEVVKKYRDL